MRYPDSLLDSLRLRGDPEVDELMVSLMEERKLEDINRLLKDYQVNGQVPAGLPPALDDWFRRTGELPQWADRERMNRATSFFMDHGISYAVLLAQVALLECYAAAKGVKALHTTDQMGYSGAKRRLGETTQFALRILQPGSLFEGGGGIPAIQKVRLMHAGARFLIREGDWDEEEDGIPANQEDLLGTLMSFSHTPIRAMHKLGRAVSLEQAEDFIHLWNVIGTVLGIPPEIQPDNREEAEEIVVAISRRHFRKSPEGVEMTAALMTVFTGMLPTSAFDGAVYAMARYAVGEEICDMLEVPTSKWQPLANTSGLAGTVGGVLQKPKVVRDVTNYLGMKMLTQSGLKLTDWHVAEFRIPTEIRRAWRLPPLDAARRAAVLLPHLLEGLPEDFEASLEGDADAVGARLVTAGLHERGLEVVTCKAYSSQGILPEERARIEAIGGQGGVGGDALAAVVERIRRQIEEVQLP